MERKTKGKGLWERMAEEGMESLARFFSDYTYKTMVTTFGSTTVRFFFILANLLFFALYHSHWHLSISIYYIILEFLWIFLFHAASRSVNKSAFHGPVHLVMLLMNLSLVAPLYIMVMGERGYRWGLVPAIGIAAYTFYRITLSILHVLRAKRSDNPYLLEIRALNLMDSLVSVLVLQNTLVTAIAGMEGGGMQLFVEVTSGVIWLLTLSVTFFSWRSVRGLEKNFREL